MPIECSTKVGNQLICSRIYKWHLNIQVSTRTYIPMYFKVEFEKDIANTKMKQQKLICLFDSYHIIMEQDDSWKHDAPHLILRYLKQSFVFMWMSLCILEKDLSWSSEVNMYYAKMHHNER